MLRYKHKGLVEKWSLYLLCLAFLGACSAVLNYEECKKNSDCSGDNLVCTKGYCIEKDTGESIYLFSEDCTRIYGVNSSDEALSEDTILLGAVLPYTGELAAKGPKIGQGIELAVDEVNLAGGLLDKKVAVLFCDSATSTEETERALQHMISLNRISAVIGPVSSSVAIESFTEVAKDANLLMMSPAATSSQITDLSDNNLFWRTAPSDAYQGQAIARFLLEEENFKKIAIINRNDVYGNGLVDIILEYLCDSFPCTDTDSFYSSVYSEKAMSSEQSQIALELEEFAPSITVLVSYFEDGSAFLDLAAQQGIQRFIVADGLKSDELLDADLPPEVLCRLVGTQPASTSGENYKSFEIRFEAKYDKVGSYSANAYDAVYLLLYAIAAADTDNPTGPDIAKGLKRLSSGNTVNAGTGDWNDTIQLLSSNPKAEIDYEGASGSLDFDSKGEAPSDIEGWALDIDQGTTLSLGTMFSHDGVVYYDVFEEVSGKGEVCAGAECTNSAGCDEGDYCDLTLETPFCRTPPSGQGETCSKAEDCESYEADYCETLVSSTCLAQGCDPTVNNCSPGYHCCDFSAFQLPSLCISSTEAGGEFCNTGTTCEGPDDCGETEYCDLTMDPSYCIATPSGQGRACEEPEDCETFYAGYCESAVSGTCLVPDCDKELNNCSPGYLCCDFAWAGLPSLCVDAAPSEGHCVCSANEDCKAADYCDLTLDIPVCYAPPTGQGQACTAAADCDSYEADYCALELTSTCLRRNCSEDDNNCSPGYRCCDFGFMDLPALCVDQATYDAQCV